jgi:chromosome segregation ATPase
MHAQVTKLLQAIVSGGSKWARKLRTDIKRTERLLRLAEHDLAVYAELTTGLDDKLTELEGQRDDLVGNDDTTANKRQVLIADITVLEAEYDRLRRIKRAQQETVDGLRSTREAYKAELKAYLARTAPNASATSSRPGNLSAMLDNDTPNSSTTGRTSAHDM